MRYPTATDGHAMADLATYGRLQTHSSTDSVDWLRRGALAGLCVDATTTWYILSTPGHRELNPVLAAFWSYDPAVVGGYFCVFAVVVWLLTRRRHWLSTTISAAVFVVMGVFGGLNNLALFVFGPPSLLDWLAAGSGLSPSTFIVAIIPACGLAIAVIVASVRHRRVPPQSLIAAVGGGGVGYLVYLGVVSVVLDMPAVLL